jgi:hypothetical protein
MRIARAIDTEIRTTDRGFRKSTSINAALTSLGGNLFVVDDPQKPVDAQSDTLRNNLHNWFSTTLLSRLDNKERWCRLAGAGTRYDSRSIIFVTKSSFLPNSVVGSLNRLTIHLNQGNEDA